MNSVDVAEELDSVKIQVPIIRAGLLEIKGSGDKKLATGNGEQPIAVPQFSVRCRIFRNKPNDPQGKTVGLRDNWVNQFAEDIGQAEVAALVPVSELFVVDPELMQHRGV